MAQCYVAPITRIPEKNVFLARVPADTTLMAGAIVDLSEIDSAIENNYQVYVASAPTATSTMLGIVINDGWEQLADGRRPEGQPDYTQYEYHAGDIVCVVALDTWTRFEISEDAIDGDAEVGGWLAAQIGEYQLAPDTTGILRVDASKYVRAGGQFGGSLAAGYIPTFICTVAIAPAGN